MADILTPAQAPVRVPRRDADRLTHFYCCDPDTGYCGADIAGTHHCPIDQSCGCIVCVVCTDLQCPVCGGVG